MSSRCRAASARSWPARRCSTPPGRCTCGSGRTTPSTTSPSRTCAVICSSRKATPSTAGAAHPRRIRCGPGRSSGRGAARLLTDSPVAGLSGTVRFDWAALDSWFEEDEQVFVHPRNPYVRVDALRSTRPVRVELNGVVLAESPSPVMVFETGLPTRYYINQTEINFEYLDPSGTVTACPYKGTTSRYWSVRTGDSVHPDLAWAYGFPTRQLLPIAGLVAFYNEKVDLYLSGHRLERPKTHFFASADSPSTS